MTKKIRTMFSLLLAFVLCFSLGIGAMAASASETNDSETDTYTFKVYLQEYDRTVDNPTANVWNADDALEITVSSGTTMKAALEAIESEYTTAIVDFTWSSSYLYGVKYDTYNLSNYGTTKYTEEDGDPYAHGTYEGASWMWYYGDADDIPASTDKYPEDTLESATITTDTVITLSYEKMVYTW